MVRDGSQREGADANAHERRVVAARGSQGALKNQFITEKSVHLVMHRMFLAKT